MGKIRLGIAGLGLIGASILKGLCNNPDYEIFCSSATSADLALKYTKNASDSFEILKDCDIVFVCSKASLTLSHLDKLNSLLSKNTVVADVCSIKKDLLNKEYNFNFILSHPMAGTEFQGFTAGKDDLFKGAKWLIEKENKLLNKAIADLGAIPLKIDMSRHDELTAQISHYPTILAFLLFSCADNAAKQLASSGFRDMTRLALTNSDLALMMFNQNFENIEKMLEKTKDKLNYLKNLSDNEKITLFENISRKRKEMYDEFGKNIFKI